MILTGYEIEKQHKEGAIVIEPFCKDQLNPNSYDLRLGDKLLIYDEAELSPKKEQPLFSCFQRLISEFSPI